MRIRIYLDDTDNPELNGSIDLNESKPEIIVVVLQGLIDKINELNKLIA